MAQQRTVRVMFPTAGQTPTKIYNKGRVHVNGCHLPDEVDPSSLSGSLSPTLQKENIVAIDFGTTCCTLAYSMEGNRDVGIRFLRLESDNERIPTSIVIDNAGIVVGFGKNARKKYAKLQPEVNHFFDQIKMNLQHDQSVSWNYVIKAMNGREFFLVEVIAMILKYLKDKFLTVECIGSTQGKLKMDDFKWAITVPAMWKARGKQMMRQAAYKAGIGCEEGIIEKLTPAGLISSPSKLSMHCARPDLLSLALEPEVAAIHCLSQAQKKNARVGESKCYLVLDIGGGTVDITAHKVNDDGSLDVVLPPTGNDWGGVRVNQKFKEMLANLVGDTNPRLFNRYLVKCDPQKKAKHNTDLHSIMQKFEEEKQMFGEEGVTENGFALIDLPDSFMKVYKNQLEGVKKRNDRNGVYLDDGDLCISYKEMPNLFKSAVVNIVSCLKQSYAALPRATTVDTVFFVGGFGGCNFIYEKLVPEVKRIFLNPTINTFRPNDHKLAVVKGAVYFLLDKSVVRARVVDATYGAACSRPFDSNLHDRGQKFFDDDRQERCNNLFTPFALKWDVVKADRVLVQTYSPLKHNQQDMTFDLYSTDSRSVAYTCTPDNKPVPGVEKIGELTVDMPIQRGDKERMVKLVFDFTHSEIKVGAYDITSGKKVYTTVDFLTDILNIHVQRI